MANTSGTIALVENQSVENLLGNGWQPTRYAKILYNNYNNENCLIAIKDPIGLMVDGSIRKFDIPTL